MAELGGSAGLMPKKLDMDYTTWAVQFQAYLETVELWETIEQPLPPNPAEQQAAFEHWVKVDRRALGRIKLGISPVHLNKLDGCTKAKEAWDKLKRAFHASTMAREIQLEREMAGLRKQPGETIMAYSGRAKGLRVELAGVSEEPMSDRRAIIHLLAGIVEPEYESIVTVLTNQHEPLGWEDVVARLLVAEASIKSKKTMAEAPAAASAPGATSAYGATAEERRRAAAERRRRITCWNCGGRGHYSNECQRPGGGSGGTGGSFGSGGQGAGGSGGQSTGGNTSGFLGTAALGARVTTRDGGRPDLATQPKAPDQTAALASPAKVQTLGDVPAHTEWVIDSGATRHMSKDGRIFTQYRAEQIRDVTLADGRTIPIVGEGAVRLMADQGWELTLSEVVHVPTIATNLMSVRGMTKKGAKVVFEGDTCTISKADIVVAVAYVDENDQYVLRSSDTTDRMWRPQAQANVATYPQGNQWENLWHRRTCHLAVGSLPTMTKVVNGMRPPAKREEPTGAICQPCVEARMQSAPFYPSTPSTTRPLQKIHVDLVGPLPPSRGGARHFIAIGDYHTEWTVGTALKTKGEAGNALRNWINRLEVQAGHKVAQIRMDGAKEIATSQEMTAFFNSKGISVEVTAPYTPQQNGRAERTNRTIMEHLRAILLGSGLPMDLWAEGLQAVMHTMNLSPTTDGKATPYERFYGRKASVSHLRVWGSKAYALKTDKDQRKLEPKVMVGWMVGYASGGKAYRVLSAENGTVYVRRDVIVDESQTPVPAAGGGTAVPATPAGSAAAESTNGASSGPEERSPTTPESQERWDELLGVPPLTEPATPSGGAGRRQPYDLRPRGSQGGGTSNQVVTAQVAAAGTPMTVEEAVNSRWWNSEAPKNVEEALSRPDAYLWQEAMDSEMASMSAKAALLLVQRTAGMHVVGSKWVFDYKHDAAGTVNRYKARLVMQGFTQIKGLDYDEAWAPCPARATVRCLLAIAAERDLEVRGLDIKTAYLNAEMDKDLYIEQPEGYERGGPNWVCKVLQALYGAKQAGKLWYEHLAKTLTVAGMTPSKADPCLFLWHHPDHGTIYVLIHVDDTLIAAQTERGAQTTMEVIRAAYETRDQGEVKDFLGMRLVRDRTARTLAISSPGHTDGLIKRFGMGAANPTAVPMSRGTDLRRTGERLLPDATQYMELVGGLLYLSTTTRPDLALAAGKLAQYMRQPEEQHWQAAKTALRYVVGTPNLGIEYGAGGTMVGAVDADYGGCPDTRRSTAGWVFTWNGAAVSWSSKREPTVATSTAEAEYIAAAAAVKEALWLRKLKSDLGAGNEPIALAEDNMACIAIAGNMEGTGRAKHIDIAHHFVRERVAMGDVSLHHVPSADMVADGFTKPLPADGYKIFRNRLGVAAVEIKEQGDDDPRLVGHGRGGVLADDRAPDPDRESGTRGGVSRQGET